MNSLIFLVLFQSSGERRRQIEEQESDEVETTRGGSGGFDSTACNRSEWGRLYLSSLSFVYVWERTSVLVRILTEPRKSFFWESMQSTYLQSLTRLKAILPALPSHSLRWHVQVGNGYFFVSPVAIMRNHYTELDGGARSTVRWSILGHWDPKKGGFLARYRGDPLRTSS
jgi:hypothetical protein